MKSWKATMRGKAACVTIAAVASLTMVAGVHAIGEDLVVVDNGATEEIAAGTTAAEGDNQQEDIVVENQDATQNEGGDQETTDQNEGGDQETTDQNEGGENNAPKVGGPTLDIQGPKIGSSLEIRGPIITLSDGTNANEVDYIDENGKPAKLASGQAHVIGKQGEDALKLGNGWYVINNSFAFDKRIEVTGGTKILVCNGAKLDAKKGIHVPSGKSLTVYGQKGNSGEIFADARNESNTAGIGGNDEESCGTITVYGATVTAKGGEDAAGIGGGCEGHGGAFNLYGGKIDAEGKEYGAGIGGGKKGNGATFKMYGGHIDAKGGTYCFLVNGAGAAIGGGDNGNGGTIEILGGSVDVRGGRTAAAIGGGEHGNGGKVTIKNATVEADCQNAWGAAIGGGEAGDACSELLIENATVSALASYGAGIGGGNGDATHTGHDGGKVVIRNSNVYAYSGNGAAIGGGYADESLLDGGDGGDVTIEGNSVVECESTHGAAIGRASDGDETGTVHLDANHAVYSFDDSKFAPKAEREGHCYYRNHVKIEPCKHQSGHHIDVCEEGHTHNCDHCYGEKVREKHTFGNDGKCTTCGFDRPMPKFMEASFDNGTFNGMTLWFKVGKECDYSDCSVELTIGGKNARSVVTKMNDAQVSGRGWLGFTIGLAPMEMGQTVEAHLTGEKVDGDKLIAATSLADAYTEYAKDGSGLFQADHQLAHSTVNFIHYMQRFYSAANGWKLGEDYAEVKQSFPEVNDLAEARRELQKFHAKSEVNGADLEGVNLSISIGDTGTIDLYVKPKAGAAFDANAQFGDQAVELVQEADGRYHAHVEGISVRDFDKFLKLEGTCGKAFDVEACVLSYPASKIRAKGVDEDTKKAMASVYWYYQRIWNFDHREELDI